MHRLRVRIVGESQPEGAVDLQLVFGVGLGKGDGQVAEAVDDGGDLVCGRCRDRLLLGGWALARAAARSRCFWASVIQPATRLGSAPASSAAR